MAFLQEEVVSMASDIGNEIAEERARREALMRDCEREVVLFFDRVVKDAVLSGADECVVVLFSSPFPRLPTFGGTRLVSTKEVVDSVAWGRDSMMVVASSLSAADMARIVIDGYAGSAVSVTSDVLLPVCCRLRLSWKHDASRSSVRPEAIVDDEDVL